MRATRFYLPTLLSLLLVGCDRGTATKSVPVTTSAAATPDLRPAFETSVDLFTEWSLPNSMSRPKGFDLNGYLDGLHCRFEHMSAAFHTPAGVTFLALQLDKERDDVRIITGLIILSESRQPAARQVIARYAKSADATVAEQAGYALARIADAR